MNTDRADGIVVRDEDGAAWLLTPKLVLKPVHPSPASVKVERIDPTLF